MSTVLVTSQLLDAHCELSNLTTNKVDKPFIVGPSGIEPESFAYKAKASTTKLRAVLFIRFFLFLPTTITKRRIFFQLLLFFLQLFYCQKTKTPVHTCTTFWTNAIRHEYSFLPHHKTKPCSATFAWTRASLPNLSPKPKNTSHKDHKEPQFQ